MWTWLSVALVIVVVLAIVLVDLVGSKTPRGPSVFGYAAPSVVAETTQIPASVFNTVGVSSPSSPITGFGVFAKQKPLTFVVGGKKLPGVIYFGAEYCPYCAATRWSIIAALARFGTFHNLSYMKSSATDVDPNTATFTFLGSSYTSKYIAFKPYEVENRFQKLLQTPPADVMTVVSLYNQHQSFPFLSFNNTVLELGQTYDPGALAGATWAQIAAGLSNPASPTTQAIVATANYFTAGICNEDGQMPSSVCASPGVQAAATALKLRK